MRFIDSLVHVTADGSWGGKNKRPATAECLIEEMDAAGVDRACAVGIAGYCENEAILSAAKQYPDRLIPIAGINPVAFTSIHELQHAMEDLAAQGFAGVKLHPRFNRYDPLDDRVVKTIQLAGEMELAAFYCTLTRRPDAPTTAPAQVVDALATGCPNSRIVFLHGGGASLLELFELGRMHAHILIDLSFTINRYAGSSLDQDLRFVCQHLDQRVVVGSDFPEYTPQETIARFDQLTEGIEESKRNNIRFQNLERWFANRSLPSM